MKKEFYALLGTKGKQKKIEKREGEYDAKNGICYAKTESGWSATDIYSGLGIATEKATKKECQEIVENAMAKLEEHRNSEQYLQLVVNFNELKGE